MTALIASVLLFMNLPVETTMAKRLTKESPEPGKITKLTFTEDGKDYPYWLYVPKNAAKQAPLILFLHGSGEREGGAKGPHQVGLPPAIAKHENFPFYVLIPQFSKQGSWVASGPDAKRAMRILDMVIKEHDIDTKRLYLTGLSMGGCGTWENAVAYPKKWAAIAPVCGYFNKKRNFYEGLSEDQIKSLKDMPIWCFHGDKDGPVPVSESRTAMKLLYSVGAHPNYTEFPGVDHNCWDLTYANPQLFKWFLGHKLK
ncbi:MAG: hypothetical protein U0796_18305 [Gemmatales bacterium]